MANKNEQIKIFLIKKIVFAFIIGILIDFSRRLIESATGPLDLFFVPVFSFFYALIFTGLVVIIGLLLLIPQIKKIWFKNNLPFIITLCLGVSFFLYGIFTAHHIYFDLHKSSKEADFYLDCFARPGYILILFSLCFCPVHLIK